MTDHADRGTNGFAYADMDASKVTAWESGQFHLQIRREDGETLRTNFRPEQFEALRDAIDDTLERAADHEEVDYDG
jgi:hypothetical protein